MNVKFNFLEKIIENAILHRRSTLLVTKNLYIQNPHQKDHVNRCNKPKKKLNSINKRKPDNNEKTTISYLFVSEGQQELNRTKDVNKSVSFSLVYGTS